MEYIKMCNYCSSVRDGTHDTPKPTADGKPLVTSKAINNNKIDFNQTYNISIEEFEKINKRSLVEQWDLLMSMIGTVGRLFLVKEKPDYAIKNVALFKVGDEKKAKWLYYCLSLKEVQDYFQAIASGTSQHFIPLNQLRKFKISNYNENSETIIDILSKYDDLIENNEKQIQILEEMAEKLYKEWFVHFRFSGYGNIDFYEGIPTIWKYEKLGDIMTFDRGISYSSEEIDCDEGLNLINLKNIQSFGGFRRDGTKKYNGKYKTSQVVKENDLIMGVTDMTQERRTVGAVALIPDMKGISVISADLVKVNSDIDNVFLYTMFRFGNISKYLSQFGNGANVIHLKPDTIKNKKILVPDSDTIKAFTDIIKPIIAQLNNLNNQNDNLIEQRDLLLPRLMSGKLELK